MDRVDDIEKLLHHGYFLVDEMHLSVHCLKKKTEIVQAFCGQMISFFKKSKIKTFGVFFWTFPSIVCRQKGGIKFLVGQRREKRGM
jgi:hypothetical protein